MKRWIIDMKGVVRCVYVQDYPMAISRDLFLSSKGKLQFHRSELYESEAAAASEAIRRLDQEIADLTYKLSGLKRRRHNLHAKL